MTFLWFLWAILTNSLQIISQVLDSGVNTICYSLGNLVTGTSSLHFHLLILYFYNILFTTVWACSVSFLLLKLSLETASLIPPPSAPLAPPPGLCSLRMGLHLLLLSLLPLRGSPQYPWLSRPSVCKHVSYTQG